MGMSERRGRKRIGVSNGARTMSLQLFEYRQKVHVYEYGLEWGSGTTERNGA